MPERYLVHEGDLVQVRALCNVELARALLLRLLQQLACLLLLALLYLLSYTLLLALQPAVRQPISLTGGMA